MLKIILAILDYALISMPLFGMGLFAFLNWRGVSFTRNLILSFGILPFPFLLACYVLGAFLVNGPHGQIDFLHYVTLSVRAYLPQLVLLGVSLIVFRREITAKSFLIILGLAYAAAIIWHIFNPYG